MYFWQAGSCGLSRSRCRVLVSSVSPPLNFLIFLSAYCTLFSIFLTFSPHLLTLHLPPLPDLLLVKLYHFFLIVFFIFCCHIPLRPGSVQFQKAPPVGAVRSRYLELRLFHRLTSQMPSASLISVTQNELLTLLFSVLCRRCC